MIVATGMYRRQLDVPGEKRLLRRGVSYHHVHELPQFAGKPVAVVGGGNSGLQAAEALAQVGCRVTIVSFGPLTGDRDDINRVTAAANVTVAADHEVLAIEGDQKVTAIRVRSRANNTEQVISVEAVFVGIGFLPNADCVVHLVERNQLGEIVVNRRGETNVPGVFAAGDVTDCAGKRIVIAAGEGAVAALAASEYLRTHADPGTVRGAQQRP